MRELIITYAGEELVARLVGGITTARFTRLCASDKDYSNRDREALKRLSELDGIRQSVEISGTRRADPCSAEIFAAMDNKALNEGYYTRTIGLYAEDREGKELLFAVCSEDASPFFMPPFTGGTVSGVSYKLKVKVGNSESINISVSADVYATAVQLEDEVKRINGRIDALSFDDDIVSHNENAASHPKLLELLDLLGERVEMLERAVSEEITANPFSVTFGNLEGVEADGIWEPAQARLSF